MNLVWAMAWQSGVYVTKVEIGLVPWVLWVLEMVAKP